MKTDTCPLCGGERRIGFFSAVCRDCGEVQRTPESERLYQAWQSFKQSLRKAFRLQ